MGSNISLNKYDDVIIENDRIYLKKIPKVDIMNICYKPIMERYAKLLGGNNIDIIEIGFGMGYFADYIQKNFDIKSHTIVEINPQIVKNIKEWGKNKKNIILIEGDWFENQHIIKKRRYHSIYYDAVFDRNRYKFKDILNDITYENSIFSYFDVHNRNPFNFENLQYEMVGRDFDFPSPRKKFIYIPYFKF